MPTFAIFDAEMRNRYWKDSRRVARSGRLPYGGDTYESSDEGPHLRWRCEEAVRNNRQTPSEREHEWSKQGVVGTKARTIWARFSMTHRSFQESVYLSRTLDLIEWGA